MQKYDLIVSLKSALEQKEFSQDFSHELIANCENVPVALKPPKEPCFM